MYFFKILICTCFYKFHFLDMDLDLDYCSWCVLFKYISVCQQGFEYDEMNDECRSCMMGSYKSSIANSNCIMCPVGRSTPTEGASSLSECGKKT